MLQANPSMTQRELAAQAGVSLGGVNYCLNALVDKGLVKIRNFRASDNKLRYAYVLTPRGIDEKSRLTARFLQRKMREYQALKAEISSLQKEMGGERSSEPVVGVDNS